MTAEAPEKTIPTLTPSTESTSSMLTLPSPSRSTSAFERPSKVPSGYSSEPSVLGYDAPSSTKETTSAVSTPKTRFGS
jgi:hypothetical protein